MTEVTLRNLKPQAAKQAVIPLNPKTICILLAAISVALVFISFVGVVILQPYSGNPYTGDPSVATTSSLAKIVLRFDVVAEGNVPSWYSGAILLVSAILLGIIAIDKYRQGAPYKWRWIALAIMFALFSLDEVAYLHEGIANFMRERSIGSLQIGWLIPGSIFVVVVGLWYLPFILNLPPKTKRLFILAACLFLTGALGLELAESLLLDDLDFQSVPVAISNHLQDLFEMLGVCVFIYALLSYIKEHMGPLRLVVH